ncbi:hypothetical protein F751_6610 [Auxenochlorella protothecoides]|uniref:Uncharacterized protein n=1 Tax=Auxenochlorella protothecoides TaxID=3075 RepID=A0A087SPH5_AUXPR|nr:hypothetical protein F751_6610 [Auxenochlorella protothecoides]KFM27629.1 hypothetical protein F751_6610 [Auxenochlorella protothecoides]
MPRPKVEDLTRQGFSIAPSSGTWGMAGTSSIAARRRGRRFMSVTHLSIHSQFPPPHGRGRGHASVLASTI